MIQVVNGEIDFHVHYLMQERDGNLRIFGWISGDEQGPLREYGIIDYLHSFGHPTDGKRAKTPASKLPLRRKRLFEGEFAVSIFKLRGAGYLASSRVTPAIFMFTSRTLSPVIFSMAVFTLSCTFSLTSGML